jgi:hypothetical protein
VTGFAVRSACGEIVLPAETVGAVVPESAVAGVGSPVAPDVGGWHVAGDAVPGVAWPGPAVEPGALVGLGWAAAVGAPPASGPVPSGAGVPVPAVPASVRGRGGYGPPPWSTVLPAWMIAWRTGCTPNERLAMTTMPVRPATSVSHPTCHPPSMTVMPGSGGLSPLLRCFSAGMAW